MSVDVMLDVMWLDVLRSVGMLVSGLRTCLVACMLRWEHLAVAIVRASISVFGRLFSASQ